MVPRWLESSWTTLCGREDIRVWQRPFGLAPCAGFGFLALLDILNKQASSNTEKGSVTPLHQVDGFGGNSCQRDDREIISSASADHPSEMSGRRGRLESAQHAKGGGVRAHHWSCLSWRSAALAGTCLVLAVSLAVTWVVEVVYPHHVQHAHLGGGAMYGGFSRKYLLIFTCSDIIAWTMTGLSVLASAFLETRPDYLATPVARRVCKSTQVFCCLQMILYSLAVVRTSVVALLGNSWQPFDIMVVQALVLRIVGAGLTLLPQKEEWRLDIFFTWLVGDTIKSTHRGSRTTAVSRAGTAGVESGPPLSESVVPIGSGTLLWGTFGYSWMNPLFQLGNTRQLDMEDIWDVRESESAHKHSSRLWRIWKSRGSRGHRSIRRFLTKNVHGEGGSYVSLFAVLIRAYGIEFLLAGFFLLIQSLVLFGPPILLQRLINFMDDDSKDSYDGYLLVAGMLACKIVATLSVQHYTYRINILGVRCRAGLVSIMYDKILLLSSAAREQFGSGKIVNLISVDAQRVIDVTTNLHTLWSLPIQIGIAGAMLWRIMGPAMFVGLSVMLVMVGINFVIARGMGYFQRRIMREKDERLKVLAEMLPGMKQIKMYSWERTFFSRILDYRRKELKGVFGYVYVGSLTVFGLWFTPIMVSVLSFSTYVWLGNELSAEVVFPSVAVFRLLQAPIRLMPQTINSIIQARISYQRAAKFLNAQEQKSSVLRLLDDEGVAYDKEDAPDSALLETPLINADKIIEDSYSREFPVHFDGACAVWESLSTNNVDDSSHCKGRVEEGGVMFSLENIELKVARGSLTAVTGPVGSGKSSLLHLALGNMVHTRGRVALRGKVSYAPQQPWIQSTSIRENIVFGRRFVPELYEQVLFACCLHPDLESLPDYDQTEVGERGVNLSGGQKQRISLARAVYCSDASIFLLDDVLSSVDGPVANHIFVHCIQGILRERTRIFVSHDDAFLGRCDNVVLLMNGRIIDSRRSLPDVLRPWEQRAATAVLDDGVDASIKIGKHSNGQRTAIDTRFEFRPSRETVKKFTNEEERAVGRVGFQVYWTYFRFMGGTCMIITLCIVQGTWQASQIGGNWWLQAWGHKLREDEAHKESSSYYLGIYSLLMLIAAGAIFLRTILVSTGGWVSSRELHAGMMDSLLDASMNFYDHTPGGRVLNRASNDCSTIDQNLFFTIGSLAAQMAQCAGILIVTCAITPVLLIPLIPVVWIYGKTNRYFLQTGREVGCMSVCCLLIKLILFTQLTRLDSVCKSPLIAHATETISGVHIVKALGMEARFRHHMKEKMNNSVRVNLLCSVAFRWLSVRLALIGAGVMALAGILSVVGRHSITGGVVGLALSYALNLDESLCSLVSVVSLIENQMVSVERVLQYSSIPAEASSIVESARPMPNWPHTGTITFKNVTMHYPDADGNLMNKPVITGLSFEIHAREKIGVVGRTGAGKSSLISALFRLYEISDGSIFIDDINIASIGTYDLRSRLAVIPQEPLLFSGPLRANIDPFDEYTDYEALTKVKLDGFVRSLSNGLHHEISESGGNLSAGQRQLLCVCRVLLRQPRVLVLDEATASVDNESDAIIQEALRNCFDDCTIITIAHRLDTLRWYDRILHMEGGRIEKFDIPARVLPGL